MLLSPRKTAETPYLRRLGFSGWYRRLIIQRLALEGGVLQEKHASEAYRATGGITGKRIANRAIVGH